MHFKKQPNFQGKFTGNSIKKGEKSQFLGYLTNTSISVLNQLTNQRFMTCYSSLQFTLLKMSNKHPSEMQN